MNIYILFGQTATGKTAKALELAKEHDGEIVNFDSRQVYQKLTIVTGKDIPKNSKFQIADIKDQKSKIKNINQAIGYYDFTTRIWLYDIVDPKQLFSSADYVACAELVLTDIVRRGKSPILVGGTGYYLYHLLYDVPKIDVPQDWSFRNGLSHKTVEELQSLLIEKDKETYATMNESDRFNPRRLIRRLEILEFGGALVAKPTTPTLLCRLCNPRGWQMDNLKIKPIPFFHSDSKDKETKIRNRVISRIEQGAIEETQTLLASGYTVDDPGLNAIGYRQIADYLTDKITKEQMIEQWITKEMQYSKRQKTFFTKLFPDLAK